MMKQKQNENQPNKPENVPDDFSKRRKKKKKLELTNDGSKEQSRNQNKSTHHFRLNKHVEMDLFLFVNLTTHKNTFQSKVVSDFILYFFISFWFVQNVTPL